MIIGQKNLIDFINKIKVPHFIVIVGSKGSGKTTLAKFIATKLDATFSVCGIKVDEIREVIHTAYTTRDNILYCIKDADNMRAEAKNAMLKITEEPPENAWFILTVQSESSLLPTIKSRAWLITMEPYNIEELKTYFWKNYNEGKGEVDIICDIASNPYEVDKLVEYGKDFLDYVDTVIDNIAEVEPANAFKSASKLALKDENGYDLKIFFETIIKICMQRLKSNPTHYATGIYITAPFIKECSYVGVNKSQLYDSWVFKIREVWI